jgi:muramoyltetrapeptide carboxypeptidase
MKIPPYLKKGSIIGITCPAGYMAKEKAQACIHTLQQWGFQVMVGKTLGSASPNYFSGNDEERLVELQAMLDSDNIDAILFGRGGYGISRIMDNIDFTRFKKKPKWLIGYSDITALHAHVHSNFKTATLHAPMAAAFNDGSNIYLQSILKAITGKRMIYKCPAHPLNKKGNASGQLIGGNLALLAHITGTTSDSSTKNKILFIEDTGEYIYAIDRMLLQLKRSGKLQQLAALIVGSFTETKDTERPFGSTVYQAIAAMVANYNYPVCYGFPVGHSLENFALKTGVVHQLTIATGSVTLKELR